MSDQRPKRDRMSLEEATISNMWDIAALVEVIKRKGLCTKQDRFDIIAKFRKQNPRAKIPEAAFAEPYLLSQTEEKIIDELLAVLSQHVPTRLRTYSNGWGELLTWGNDWRKAQPTNKGGSDGFTSCTVDAGSWNTCHIPPCVSSLVVNSFPICECSRSRA